MNVERNGKSRKSGTRTRGSLRRLAVATVGVAILSCGVGCSHESDLYQEILRERIGRAFRSKLGNANPVYIDMKEMTPFEWDRVYVFGPRTSYRVIRDSLGFGWRRGMRTRIDERDDINLVVFVQAREVVGYVAHPRVEGDFSGIERGRGYTRDEAYFEVVEVGMGEGWLVAGEVERES